MVSLLFIATPFVSAAQDPCDTPGQGNAKYWFYIEDPSAYAFYDPEAGPNYVGVVSDDWVTESVVESIDWESFAGTGTNAEFIFWMIVTNSESQNTKVVISINDAAYDGIARIWVNGIEITSWTTSSHPYLAPHGIFNSAEFYGYYELDIGYLAQSMKGGQAPAVYPVEISFEVEVAEGASNDMKIHLDAYGCEGSGPYSHDAVAAYWPDIPPMLVPEVMFGTIATVIAGVAAVFVMRQKGITIALK
jgi:hypothetical protein